MEFLIFAFLVISTTFAICPVNYTFVPELKICVIRVDVHEDYHEFKELKCQENFGHLLKINNQFENQLLANVALTGKKKGLIEIGLRAVENGNNSTNVSENVSWFWADGSEATFFNWAPKHPVVDRSHGCVGWNETDLKWYSIDCELTRLGYICQAPNDDLSARNCEPGWLFNNSTKMCYSHNTGSQVNVDEAENLCLSTNSHLVSVHSDEENNFITGLSFMNSCGSLGITLTGGSINSNRSRIVWSDGSVDDYTKNYCVKDYGSLISIQAYPSCCHLDVPSIETPCDGDGQWMAWSTPDDGRLYSNFFCKKSPVTARVLDI